MTDGQDHFKRVNPPLLTARGLFAEALLEVDALGTQPRSTPGHSSVQECPLKPGEQARAFCWRDGALRSGVR